MPSPVILDVIAFTLVADVPGISSVPATKSGASILTPFLYKLYTTLASRGALNCTAIVDPSAVNTSSSKVFSNTSQLSVYQPCVSQPDGPEKSKLRISTPP